MTSFRLRYSLFPPRRNTDHKLDSLRPTYLLGARLAAFRMHDNQLQLLPLLYDYLNSRPFLAIDQFTNAPRRR
jgi:hypothetical protein